MRKIIAIGESVLDILFDENDRPEKSFVGGRIANAAAILGKGGYPVSMVSECCNDHTGDVVFKFLSENGIDTTSIDRYVDGATAVSLIYRLGGDNGVVRSNYGVYPNDRFDVVWPRIDEDDLVIFGSWYSIDETLRSRLFEMVTYASSRKSIIMYLPGCQHGISCRITKVMPAILENLEISDIIVANRADIETIFPGEGPEKAFRNHIEYYNPRFFFIDDDYSVTIYSHNNEKIELRPTAEYAGSGLAWQSKFIAALSANIFAEEVTKETITAVTPEQWRVIAAKAIEAASKTDE